MPLDQTSAQKATTQAGIKDATPSIPSPQGVTSSAYPKQTPVQSSLKPSATGTYTPAHTGSPWDAVINALTPDQRAQWDAIGTSYEQQQRATQQQHTDMDLRVSGSAYNAALNRQTPNDAAGKAIQLYSLLTPEQQKLWKEAQKAEEGPGFLQAILPLVAAALVVAGGEAFLGASGAGAGAGSAAAAAGTGEVAASTAAAGEAAAATTAAEAGTLADITVSAAPELVTSGQVAASVAESVAMPAAVSGGSSFAQTLLMSGLKQGAINSVLAGVTGGDPLKGFERGFAGGVIGGGISAGLQSWEASTGALDAIGNTGIKAFNSAIAGAGTAAILGGDPLKAGLGGFAGSLGSSAMSNIFGTSGQFDVGGIKIDLAKTIGSVGGSMAMSALLGGNKKNVASGYYASNQPTKTTTNTNTAQPGTPDLSAFNFPTITRTPVTMPSVPYYGVGYGGGAGGVASSGDESYWGDDQEKLKKLLAALQQQG